MFNAFVAGEGGRWEGWRGNEEWKAQVEARMKRGGELGKVIGEVNSWRDLIQIWGRAIPSLHRVSSRATVRPWLENFIASLFNP